jgi:hypothetical protein
VTRRLPPSNGTQRRGVPESRRSAGRLVGVAGWSLAMMGGCAPEDELPLPPVVWEGESVRVRMDDPEIEVCGGSFEALDRHAELVRDALLLDGDGVIEYSIGDQGFVDERCTDSPNACTKTTTGAVFVSEPFILHEIVHAVRILDPHISLRSSPIEEGLATLFGSDDLGEGTVSLDAIGILEDTNVIGASEYMEPSSCAPSISWAVNIPRTRRLPRLSARARQTSRQSPTACRCASKASGGRPYSSATASPLP